MEDGPEPDQERRGLRTSPHPQLTSSEGLLSISLFNSLGHVELAITLWWRSQDQPSALWF